jgi:hypothetical protein
MSGSDQFQNQRIRSEAILLATQAVDWQLRVDEWDEVVLTYESLKHQIDCLLLSNGGITRNMSDDDYISYRQLAINRDLVCHMMQVLEHELLEE